jgi:predicted RNA-binding Zn-ribbon protein involved in translation (DUF1610 family)
MNVKRIVVDELPESCWECGISQVGIQGKWYCPILNASYLSNVRPDACPLVVEEVCEWVHKFYDTYKSDCKESIVSQSSYIYCPNCGKRIVRNRRVNNV